MATTWNSFPGESIRSSANVYFQKQPSKDAISKTLLTVQDYEYRCCFELAYYVDVTTISTTSAACNAASTTFVVVNPRLGIPDVATGLIVPVTYSGTFFVTNFRVTDNGNGTSRIEVNLERLANWQSYASITGTTP